MILASFHHPDTGSSVGAHISDTEIVDLKPSAGGYERRY